MTFKTNTPLISTTQSADPNGNGVRARLKSPAVRRRAPQRGGQKQLMVRTALVSDPRSRVEKKAPGWAVNSERLLEHQDYPLFPFNNATIQGFLELITASLRYGQPLDSK